MCHSKSVIALILAGCACCMMAPSLLAQDQSWVEKRLGSEHEMQILFQAAEALVKQGKVDGARASLLASTDAIRQALPKARLPAIRQQILRYEKVAPLAYAGFEFQGGEAAFKALIDQHAPGLKAAAEEMDLPPVGRRFKNPKDRIQRVLRARAALEEAAKAAKAYALLAPSPEAHLKLAESKQVTASLRLILFGAIALNDHLEIARSMCSDKVKALKAKTEEALSADKVGLISQHATEQLAFAGYLSQLGKEAEAKAFSQHAEAAIAKERALRETRIASNRLPKDRYTGADKEELRALVKKQFLARFPKDTVLAVRLVGQGFVEQSEWVKVKEETWAWRRIRRYQWAYVAYQTPKDKETCSIYPLRIEQRWTGAKFGDPYTYKPLNIYGYTMLAENIDR